MGCGIADSMSDNVVDDDFDEVIDNVTMCSECDDYMEHEILKERKVGTGCDLLLKCKTCASITLSLIHI